MKRAFEMWPDDLIKRRKAERKPEWDRKVAALLSRAKKDIADFEAVAASAAKAKSNSDKQDAVGTSASAESTAKGIDGESSKAGQSGVSSSSSSTVATAAFPPTTTKIDDSTKTSSSPSTNNNEDKARDKAKKQDLEARLTYLSELSIEDPGPILDIAVWHDGSDWRCVVGGAEGEGVDEDIAPLLATSSDQDTASAPQKALEAGKSKEGEKEEEKKTLDLRGKKPMADFAKERHYERFGTQDLLSYSAKFYDDGEILRCGGAISLFF